MVCFDTKICSKTNISNVWKLILICFDTKTSLRPNIVTDEKTVTKTDSKKSQG